jgi:hypothetical protein
VPRRSSAGDERLPPPPSPRWFAIGDIGSWRHRGFYRWGRTVLGCDRASCEVLAAKSPNHPILPTPCQPELTGSNARNNSRRDFFVRREIPALPLNAMRSRWSVKTQSGNWAGQVQTTLSHLPFVDIHRRSDGTLGRTADNGRPRASRTPPRTHRKSQRRCGRSRWRTAIPDS